MASVKVLKKYIAFVSIVIFFAFFILFLFNNSDDAKSDNSVNIVQTQTLEKQPISILSSDGSRHEYIVEIAKTQKQQQIGMMFRKSIDQNSGMLFLFNDEGEHSFWMKNTLIPLDIIFISKGGIISHIHSMAEVESLKPISSQGKVVAVLEISGGETDMLGINVGDLVLYDNFFEK